MIDFTLETHLDRSAGEVFDYITDPAQLPNWQTNTVSSVPDGPMGVGTRLARSPRPAGESPRRRGPCPGSASSTPVEDGGHPDALPRLRPSHRRRARVQPAPGSRPAAPVHVQPTLRITSPRR